MSAITTAPSQPATLPTSLAEPQSSKRRTSIWRLFFNGLPNLVVFSMLAGVFYVGHHTGWKLPHLSALQGKTTTSVDDWCSEHLVPASKCVECNADLYKKPKSFGFCRVHGVAECVIHHPSLAQVKEKPTLPKYDTAKAIAVIARPTNNSRDTLHTRRVQFTSAETVTKAGVDVDVVQERAMVDAVSANGELSFDPTRVAHLSAKAPGTISHVFKTVGDKVDAGEILAFVDAAQVGQAKAELLQSMMRVRLRRSEAERMRRIATSGAIAQKTSIEAEGALQEAEGALIAARQALTNLGFEIPKDLNGQDSKQIAEQLTHLGIPASLLPSLGGDVITANLIPIRATYGGVVVSSEIVVGEVVDTNTVLFTVADPERLWLIVNVPQESAKYVKKGLTVRFRGDDGSDEVEGQISWISPSIDESTRTLKARIVVNNVSGKLRDKTFGTGRIILREEPNAIVVPKEAVQSTSDAHFVFVRDKNFFDEKAPKVFYVRQVRIGAQDDQFVELLAGVLPNEVVATKGSPVLLAQLRRSSLGAGCACHDH